MKRLTAICMALLLLFSATAFADWEAGLGPDQPYSSVPKVNFDDTLGYMLYAPNGVMSMAYTKTLLIYLPREDVTINSNSNAKLTVRSSNPDVEPVTIAINDTNAVQIRDLTSYELEGLMWGSGKCVEIELPVSLRLDCTYYVDMDDRVIIDEAREIGNPAFKSSDSDYWHFTLIADYGVSELAYLRDVNGEQQPINKPTVGDTARFDLVLGGAAKAATIAPQGMITFSETTVTESCEITATIEEDYPQWQIIFWDVETPPTDVNEQVEHIVDVLYF